MSTQTSDNNKRIAKNSLLFNSDYYCKEGVVYT